MRIKQPEFLELLNTFIGEYMPLTAGLSDNTVRLYKATFRLLLTFLFETKEGTSDLIIGYTKEGRNGKIGGRKDRRQGNEAADMERYGV